LSTHSAIRQLRHEAHRDDGVEAEIPARAEFADEQQPKAAVATIPEAVPIELPKKTPEKKRGRRSKKSKSEEAQTETPRRARRLGGLKLVVIFACMLFAAALVGNYFLLQSIGPVWARFMTSAVLFGCAGIVTGMMVTRAARKQGLYSAASTSTVEALKESFDVVGSPRVLIGHDLKIVHANRAFREYFVRQRGDGIAAITSAIASHTQGRSDFSELCERASAGVRAQIEVELTDSMGRVDWRRIDGIPMDHHHGFFVIHIDIPKKSETAELGLLKDEQLTFASFFENAPIGFYSADDHGRLVYMNNTLTNWLGVSQRDIAEGVVQLHNHIVTHGPPLSVPYDPFGGDEGAGEGEVIMRDLRGRQFPAQIIQRFETNGEGELRTRSIVRDLTPERLWQQTAQNTEAKIESLVEDSPVGVAVLDDAAVVRECNPALRIMLADDGTAPEGQSFVEMIADGQREDFVRAFHMVLDGQVIGKPLEIQPQNGESTTLSVFMSRFNAANDAEVGVFVHCLDLSEQRKLEMQVSHSQKMQAVGQLAGGVAHDFNNLLTAMIGYCDLLLMRHRPGEQTFADITQIKQNANRAAELVRQLLAFSRQQTLKPHVLKITDVMTDLLHLLRRLVGSNIQLQVTHGRELWPVRADRGQLEQVVMNLVVNARDAMKEGGTVEIKSNNVRVPEPVQKDTETLPAGDYVLIEVIDQGTGISREIIDRIFEPFFSTKKQGEGTGLGLATVYGIVKQTGGHLFVDSQIGSGTRFSIYLPAYEAAEGEDIIEVRPTRGGVENVGRDLTGAGTIMLVEDEEAVRQFGARALRNKGYDVIEEVSGQPAFQSLLGGKGKEVDLIITDIMMPDMDGTALIREVQERWPHIKIICISGYAEDTFREKIDKADDVYFLPKPFSLSQLAGLVKDIMPAA
jgi:two-component system cell cycle sensor histidine kinase/response regulator CckA